jgi:DNA polymerase III subunit delta
MSESVYLLTGESFLADEALDRVRDETQADPLSEIILDPSVAPAEIAQALGTASLLGGRRLVIVREAEGLKKDQVGALENWLEAPSEDATLVLIASGRHRLSSLVQGKGAVVNLEAPKGRRLASWIKERGQRHGVGVDDRGAWALIEAIGADLRELDASLEQLATGLGENGHVSAGEVHDAFARVADERIFVLTDAVGERRTSMAMVTLRKLLDQDEPPLLLLGSLVAHVKRLLAAHRLAGAGRRALADALGMPDWRAERIGKQSRSYREDELVRALSLLAEADVEMKGGDLPPEIALERAVLQILQPVEALRSR